MSNKILILLLVFLCFSKVDKYLSLITEGLTNTVILLQNVSKDDANEKIEREEAGNPKESASDSYFTHPLVNETVHAGDEKQDQVSSAEPEEEACHGNRILKEEKELANEAYETIGNPDSFRLEQSSIEGEVNMELISSTDNETTDVNKQVRN